METNEAKAVKDCLDLSDREFMEIQNYQRGQALISANNNRVPVEIRPSEKEKYLITTDAAELRQAAEMARKEREKNKKNSSRS